MENSDKLKDEIFFDKYKVMYSIGQGSFGKVYIGKDIKTEDKFALKFEEKKDNNELLKKEAYTMLELKHNNLPKVYSFGATNKYNILVMELLGESLEKIHIKLDKKFSLKSVCLIGTEMLNIFNFIHSKGYLHRDLKPDNYMFGKGKKSNRLYMIDFGLSKKYIDSNNNHLPPSSGKKLVGTARYASINTHKGLEQGRRDDLESIGYILVYLFKGFLPWQGLKVNQNEDHYAKISLKKQEVKIADLCEGLPQQFVTYLNYCKKLKYEEQPDYKFLSDLFKEILCNNCGIMKIEYEYEWLSSSKDKKEFKDEANNSTNNSNIISMIMNNKSINKSMKVSKNSNHSNNLKLDIEEGDPNREYKLDVYSFK